MSAQAQQSSCVRTRKRSARAFTLLELILALTLSVLATGIIAGLVEMYASNFKTRGEDIRRVALARSILNMIADDLRSTVQEQKFDTSVLQQMMMGQSGSGGGGAAGGGSGGGGSAGGSSGAAGGGGQAGGQAGGGGFGGGSGLGSTSGGNTSAGGAAGSGAAAGGARGGLGSGGGFGSTMQSGMTGGGGGQSGSGQTGSGQSGSGQAGASGQNGSDPAAEGQTTVATLPLGITGSATSLTVDISRLPRPDEYYAQQTSLASGYLADVPGDIKNVYYYVQTPTSMGIADTMNSVTSTPDATGMAGGLVRRALDRTVINNAEALGQYDQLNRTGDLIAPEVLSLDFMYYDGTQWLTTWDSSTQGLPWLVEISLAMQSKSGEKNGIVSPGISLTTMTVDDRALYGIEIYRLTVAIPGAQLQTTEATGTDATGATDSGMGSLGL